MTDEQPLTTEAVMDRLAELNITLSDDMPYRMTTLFPRLSGWGAKGEIKRKAKLIRNTEPRLRQMLNDGEEILFVSQGVQSSFSEAAFIGGLWANYINQTLFVLTNLRLILMHCTSKGVPKEPNWMLFYSEIEVFKPNWAGQVRLSLRDGKKFSYSGFPKADRNAMPEIFRAAVDDYRAMGFQPTTTQSRENLCNHCFQVVPSGERHCDECGTTFWKPSQLAWRSLVFPSWGDFLMGHTMLGVFEIFGWLVTVLIAVSLITDKQAGDLSSTIAGVSVIAFSHTMDSLLTYSVARKGLHTRSRGN
jgi:hypothetical protein